MVAGHAHESRVNESLPLTCLRELGSPSPERGVGLKKIVIASEAVIIPHFNNCLSSLEALASLNSLCDLLRTRGMSGL